MKNNPVSAREELLKNKKYRIMRFAIVVLAAFVVVMSFFNRGGVGNNGTADEFKSVTISIECKALVEHPELLADNSLEGYIPEDGVIIRPIEYQIRPGKTNVFQITQQVCMDEDIQLDFENSSLYGGAYIKGINYIYEFSAGKESGWMYYINGESPSYGADKMILNGGENILWSYTVAYED